MSKSVWMVLIGVVACTGGCDDEAATADGASSASAATASASASAPAPEPSAEPAPEAKPENAVTFTSKQISMDGFTLTHTEATKHKMSTGAKSYVAIIVHLANYDRGGGTYLPRASKDGQRKVTLNFAAPSDPKAGKYEVGGVLGESNKLSVGIHTRDHHVGLIQGTGVGEITSIDESSINGKVSVKDEHGTTIEATFTAPFL